MRKVRLTAKEDFENGFVGLVPDIFKDWENYTPVGGFGAGLAHDLMEHGTKETGAVYQELKALGAFLYVRGFGDYVTQYFNEELFGLSNFDENLISQTTDEVLPDVPRFSFPSEYRERMNEYLTELRKAIFSEKFAADAISNYGYDEEMPEFVNYYRKNFDIIAKWLEYGFASTYRRYKGEYVWNTFQAISKTVNEFRKKSYYDDTPKFQEGETFTLTYGDGWAEIEQTGWGW
jgi:hypothetical protein